MTLLAINPRAAVGDDKLIGIELLRFASAIAVLVFHYQHFAFVGTTEVHYVAADQPFYGILSLFYNYGFYGVQVFWCISGFIFFWKYAGVIAGRELGGYSFFILRLSRLYPLHFATLLFVAAMQAVYFAKLSAYYVYEHNDLYHFVLQLFMASNWGFEAGESFNGPIWSISIEVLAYCIFFLSLRYISASVYFVAAMAAVPAAIIFFKISVHPLFSCLMFFYLGCLTAIAYARVKDTARLRRLATLAALALLAAMLTLQFFVHVKPMYFLLAFSPALIYLCVSHIRATKFASRWLVAAGSMTYSSYLLHVPVQLTVATIAVYADWSLPYRSPAFFIAFMLVTLFASFYCYKHLEMPAQNYLRRRFRYKGSTARGRATG
jgi:peptidoglycan/LPS O-acetylase OafA/YrhL